MQNGAKMTLTNTKQVLLFIFYFLLLTSFSSFSQNVPSYVPTNGLVACYPFNGNANDESGNGNHGIVNGAALTTDRNNQMNKSYSFSQTQLSYIKTNNLATSIVDNFTYSAWVNSIDSTPLPIEGAQSNNSKQCVIHPVHGSCFGNYSTNSGSGLYVGKNGIVVVEHSHDYIRNALVYSGSLIGWHLITIQYENKIPKLYIDGQFVKAGIPDTRFVHPSMGFDNNSFGDYSHSGFGVGFNGSLNNSPQFFNGKIDDICIWNRALTQQEITNLYNASVPPPFPTLPSNLQTGLVGYWPFCGNANDESGNGNNGTVNGATLTVDRFGDSGRAYSFNGVNSYISTNAFFDASQDFSFSCWVNSNNTSNQTILNTIPHTILGFGLNPGWIGQGNIGFLYGTGQSFGWINNNYYFVNPNSYLNVWVKHMIVKSGATWSFFQNGSLVHSFIATSQPANIISNLVFGHCDPSVCTEALSGKIDDICIWNRALSPQEATQLYQATAPPGNFGINVENPQYNLHIRDVMKLEPRAAAPANPTKGVIYFDENLNKLRVYDGTSWQNCW